MDSEELKVHHGILSVEEMPLSSSREKVFPGSNLDGLTVTAPPSAWQELFSESAIDMADIEEGPLNELGDAFESFQGKSENLLKVTSPGWKQFVSDPSLNQGDGEGTGDHSGRRYLGEDLEGRNRKDWSQFLSTSSHLNEGEGSSKVTPPLSGSDEVLEKRERSNEVEDTAARRQAPLDMRNKLLTTDISAASSEVASSRASHFTTRASAAPLREASGSLPIRPLTIGDSLTVGNPLSYRPISPFNPDQYPSRTASSTPVVPTLPSMSQPTEDILDADTDERDGDMSARERLQPLGRDGLEVKLGPPWGIGLPLFQPHSRKSSFSSDDSNSSNGSAPLVRHQPPALTPDSEAVVPTVFSDGRLSSRSFTRSVESKEPVAVNAFDTNGTVKIRKGQSQQLNPTNADIESRLSSRSSVRSVESKEPVAVNVFDTNGTVKTRKGQSQQLNPTNADIESRLSSRSSVRSVESKQPMAVNTSGSYEIRTSQFQQLNPTNADIEGRLSSRSSSRSVESKQPMSVNTNGSYEIRTSQFQQLNPTNADIQGLTSLPVVSSTLYEGRLPSRSSSRSVESKQPMAVNTSGSYEIRTSQFQQLNPTNADIQGLTSLPVVSSALYEDRLSSRSSSRSMESKEPIPPVPVVNPSGTPMKTRIGQFQQLHRTNGDVESPVSKILGPTFKATQKMLEDLKRRPLGTSNEAGGERTTREEDDLKILAKDQETFSGEIDVGTKDERLLGGLASDQSGISVAKSTENDQTDRDGEARSVSEIQSSHEAMRDFAVGDNLRSQPSATPKTEPRFLVGNDVQVNRSFPSSIKSNEFQRLADEDNERRPYRRNASHKASGTTDSTLGNSVAISENSIGSFHSIRMVDDASQIEIKHGEGPTTKDALSWENVLKMPNASGEMSDFDRVASQSLMLTNAVANRFREELKSVDLRDVESDDEGTLVNEMPLPDSGLSDSTTNGELFCPKGLEPLPKGSGPLGIYDIRQSCGPGSTNRRRLALGQQPRKAIRPVMLSGVYVSEGTTGTSGTEVDDKGLKSEPEGQSTPRSDDVETILTNENSERLFAGESVRSGLSVTKGVRIPVHSGTFTRVQSSAAVEHTWSILSPVMSQLDTRTTHLLTSEEKQKTKDRLRNQQEDVYSSEYGHQRVSHHKEHSKKPLKTVKLYTSSYSSESISSEQSPQDRSGRGQVKKSVADIILENFRRDEEEQKKRKKKMEQLKHTQTTQDLNALWERFQEFLGTKNYQRQNEKLSDVSRSRSTHRTPPSELSVASSSDIPFIENNFNKTVDLTTDSDEEFEKFLRRVREVQSSDSMSGVSRNSSVNHRRKLREAWSTPSGRVNKKHHVPSSSDQISSISEKTSEAKPSLNRKPHRQAPALDQITSTSAKSSEAETPLALPMWLGMKTRHSKRKLKGSSGSAVCTCGAKPKKAIIKAPAVRDVGVNCPTPPVVLREADVLNIARIGINVPKVAPSVESRSNNDVPHSLVKLTLQDAFMYSKHDFIQRSRERVKKIKGKRKEASDNDVVVIPTDRTKQQKERGETETANVKPLKLYEQLQQRKPRQMTQKEIRDVNKRMYKTLPEVKKRSDEQRLAEFYKTNRLRAQLYGKHVRNTLNRIYTAP